MIAKILGDIIGGIVITLPMGIALGTVLFLALLAIVPNPLRQPIRDLAHIRSKRVKNQVTTPIERELELVAGPQRVIDDSHSKVQDLRGTLIHETNVLMQRQDELATAEANYYKAADDKNDTGLDELVMLVGEHEQEVTIQQGVVDGVQSAVVTACKAVDKARKELRHVQMTIKSDEAKAKATQALDAAAKVMEAARSITANGGALKEASGEVDRDFEEARARVDGLDGTPVERELRQIGERQQIADLRQRLDAKRAGKTDAPPSAPAQSQS